MGIELANWKNLGNLDYADDLVYLFKYTAYAQRALNKLAIAVAPFRISTAASRCEALL